MTNEELIERLLGGCSCNIDTSPCMAEDDCRLDMEAARRICALTEQLEAARRDAKEAEAYALELEARLATCEKYRDAYAECDRIATEAVRDLEARLADALERGFWAGRACGGSKADIDAALADLKDHPK